MCLPISLQRLNRPECCGDSTSSWEAASKAGAGYRHAQRLVTVHRIREKRIVPSPDTNVDYDWA
jgi:hypothetical protein